MHSAATLVSLRALLRASSRRPASLRPVLITYPLAAIRARSATTYHRTAPSANAVHDGLKPSTAVNVDTSSLSRMKISALIRNIFLGFVFTSPRLLNTMIPLIDKIANSSSILLNLDRNPILRAALKLVVYAQFCAGANDQEISKTRETIRAMGFSGVVLCFGKEVRLTEENAVVNKGYQQASAEVVYWRDGTLQTVDMTREGDWIGIKLTGAGSNVVQALRNHSELSQNFNDAINLICERAKSKKCKIWIDAEQQAVQGGIDKVTIDLMRRYNRNGNVLVYNTLQAYLKDSRAKLEHQLALAHLEGWELAIKLVRGAYIANDQRSLIHNTKQDTDANYDRIIYDILQGKNLGFLPDEFPRMQLLIAGHNPRSVIRAFQLSRQLNEQGRLKARPDFAQLQGMADVLGCDLIQRCDGVRQASLNSYGEYVPRVYKCLTWGSVKECIQFLLRRMVENGSASDRIRDGHGAYVGELRRRIFGR